MTKVERQRTLVRLRLMERRSAATGAAGTGAQVDRTVEQIARLQTLSMAISPGTGILLGVGFAGAGEYLTRLADGHLMSERRLNQQKHAAELAQQHYAVSDVKLQIAQRLLDTAQRCAELDLELRLARQRPARRRRPL